MRAQHSTDADIAYMHCFSASPCPWKNRKDRIKSAMKIRTKLMTTALVVDSPTPFAPPVVVKPQLQLTCNDIWYQCILRLCYNAALAYVRLAALYITVMTYNMRHVVTSISTNS